MNLVSIIVATYKRDVSLKKALKSLACQSYKNIEIILVDDNQDKEWNVKVEEIVKSIKEDYPSLDLNYIANYENLGSAKARNIGIFAAKGDYITFLDDDDVYLKDKVKKQLEFMQEGDFDYSITDLMLYNKDDKKIDRRIRTYIKDTSIEALKIYHLKYHLSGTDAIMFRKKYLIDIGGFPPINVGDEFYLMQNAIEASGKFGYLSGCEIKAYVHIGEDGLSSGDGKIKGENALYQYKKTFFNQIDSKTRRYIRMRHYAVIAFTELRRRRLLATAINAGKSFCCAPFACLKMFLVER